MDTLLQDLRYALRTLRKSPGFTAVAVLTLALGIGANTAVFSVVEAVLLRSLPFRDPDRLVVFWNRYAEGLSKGAISPPEFADQRRMLREFEGVAAVTDWGVNLTGRGEPERVRGYRVSPNLFSVLGVAPARGRAFAPGEGVEGNREVVVLSDELWRRSFGADPAVLGSAVRLNDQTYTVIGIMPRGVRFPDAPGLLFPERADLWVPRAWEQEADDRGNQYLRVVGRLRQGTTPERLRADLRGLAAGFKTADPDRYSEAKGWAPVAVPLGEEYVGEVRPALLVLAGAVGLVLLIACANVANLLLARSAARRREVAVRAALGAGRGRLVRQLFTESLVLALAGGSLGVLLAAWGVATLARTGPQSIPRLEAATVDPRVGAFALGVSLLTAVLFGLAPALALARGGAPAALAAGARGTADPSRRRARSLIVAAEVALAVVVLVGAGLLLRSFAALLGTDPGFRTQGVLTFQVGLPFAKYDEPAKQTAFYEEMLARVSTLPGVRTAAVVRPLPLSGDGWGGSFMVKEQPVPPGGNYPHAEYAAVTPGYFRAMGIPLGAGRDFTMADRAGAPEVVVVDRWLAEKYWPGQDPIGKQISVAGRPDSVFATVVGVVGHVRSGGLHLEGEPQIYLPFLQRPFTANYAVVRADGDPLRLAGAVRAEVRAIDRDIPLAKVRTMEQVVSSAMAQRQFSLLLISVFALSALVLAAVGIYGVASYTVAQRTREIGIRMALGARAADVLRMVVREGLVLVGAGVALGTLGALALSRLLTGLLYGLGAADPPTYVGVALLIAAVAVAASVLPARRAARVDPAVALRTE
ncbi:MAG TPA: ABC transporter permease [Longimicrobium sp.]|jgi:putative ABC transport system permease protein